MASPKSRISRSRRGMRRAHQRLKTPGLSVCKNCGAQVRSHCVCLSCGWYKNRQVLVSEKQT